MTSQKESNEKLVHLMKQWQKIEDASVNNSTEVIKNSENPLVHLVMEIIRQDSVMHRRVQQLIIDHLEKKPLVIDVEELKSFWDLIEDHNEIEKKTIALAEEAFKDVKSPIIAYMLDYLLNDERKHDKLLDDLNKIKLGMYPYGGY
jgi:hypothetical protein